MQILFFFFIFSIFFWFLPHLVQIVLPTFLVFVEAPTVTVTIVQLFFFSVPSRSSRSLFCVFDKCLIMFFFEFLLLFWNVYTFFLCCPYCVVIPFCVGGWQSEARRITSSLVLVRSCPLIRVLLLSCILTVSGLNLFFCRTWSVASAAPSCCSVPRAVATAEVYPLLASDVRSHPGF